MSLLAGLTAPVKLAGIVALSSYLPLSTKFRGLLPQPESNKATPVFMAHGTSDVVVRTELGKGSFDYLKELGYGVSWKTYA